MKIEIWSDIMCPFCYIGKHHFQSALSKVGFSSQIEVVYKSYQLNPNIHYIEGETVYSMLSKSKGISTDQAREMSAHVIQMASLAGLKINFDTNIPANTLKAHVLIHFAAEKLLAAEMKELLFEAHFVKGLNIEDDAALVHIGESLGYKEDEIRDALSSQEYLYRVNQDFLEARQLGISGVPFFLFDRKYAVSGAQPVGVFVEVIEKSFTEWKQKQTSSFEFLGGKKGDASCGPEGCEI